MKVDDGDSYRLTQDFDKTSRHVAKKTKGKVLEHCEVGQGGNRLYIAFT